MNEHIIREELLGNRVHVTLVGAGGNGSQMLNGLARLHTALRAVGHLYGLHVTVWDADRVSAANVGRQLFSPADIGQSKACLLVHRVNAFFGLNWDARPQRFEKVTGMDRNFPQKTDLLITCVDTAASRREIHHAIIGEAWRTPYYWLDLGNTQSDGQVILGEPRSGLEYKKQQQKGRKRGVVPVRLPTVMDIFPDLLDEDWPEDDRPSCSLAEALEKQDLFINDHMTRWALHLLWTLFRKGKIEHHGYFINLASGTVNPLPVPDAHKKETNDAASR